MSHSPFDGVLLDDPRDPIPGAVAVLLHLEVERQRALEDRRPSLGAQAVLDRARACQALLGQGLGPEALRALLEVGLPGGSSKDAHSLQSLIRHLEAYLARVEARGYLEPAVALWRAAGVQAEGGRGFWVERHPEDGPLRVELPDLAPPRLRALCALPELGRVVFRLATHRGAGARGLFADREPHLVRHLLPALERLAVERGLEHLELEAPEGWAENPWGTALDGLFEGALALSEPARTCLRRGLLPNPAALLGAVVEQVAAWVGAGYGPEEITLVHPQPGGVGPLLGELLRAEGIPMGPLPGRSLAQARDWAALWALLQGLRRQDPAQVAEGLAAAGREPVLVRALGRLGDLVAASDQAGVEALEAAIALLGAGEGRRIGESWAFFLGLRGQAKPLPAWARDLGALVGRLELVHRPGTFYPAFGLLEEAWAQGREPVSFGAMVEALGLFLEMGEEEPRGGASGGVRLLPPSALAGDWAGARATLVMDLGEGAWPAQGHPPPDLDWNRRLAINGALRAWEAAGGGEADFPPSLQTFWLPQAEAGEVLPRGFQREAYGFNRALALTSEAFVALSSERDGEGGARAQGPFWAALEGAGPWEVPADRAASALRQAWEASGPDGLASARQASLRVEAPDPEEAAQRGAPEADWVRGWWTGGTEEAPLSPTALESLARCPFRVFAERGLGVPSFEEGPSFAMDLGILAHGLLEGLLGEVAEADHWPVAFLARHGLARAEESALADLVLRRWAAEGAARLEALPLRGRPRSASERTKLGLGLEELVPGLGAFLAWDLQQAGPTEEECRLLGLPADRVWQRRLAGLERGVGPLPLTLDTGPLWVRGQVDRLERLDCGERAFLRLYDYKTSSPTALRAYAEDGGAFGVHLQLPLYQALLEAEQGLPVSDWLVPLRGFTRPVPMMFGIEAAEERARLRANLGALAARAEAGHFPALPGDHCGGCTLAALCGRPVDLDAPESGEEEA